MNSYGLSLFFPVPIPSIAGVFKFFPRISPMLLQIVLPKMFLFEFLNVPCNSVKMSYKPADVIDRSKIFKSKYIFHDRCASCTWKNTLSEARHCSDWSWSIKTWKN